MSQVAALAEEVSLMFPCRLAFHALDMGAELAEFFI